MRFSRQGHLEAGLLAEPGAEGVCVKPAHAHSRLFNVVGVVAQAHMILPLLVIDTGIVVRLEGEEGGVVDLVFRDPEGLINLDFVARLLDRCLVIAAHDEFACRDADERDAHALSDLNGLLLCAEFLLKLLGDLAREGPVCRRDADRRLTLLALLLGDLDGVRRRRDIFEILAVHVGIFLARLSSLCCNRRGPGPLVCATGIDR